MKKILLTSRPQRISKETFELADAFVPLVQRMLRDPTIVFSRAEVLVEQKPNPEYSCLGVRNHRWGTHFKDKEV